MHAHMRYAISGSSLECYLIHMYLAHHTAILLFVLHRVELIALRNVTRNEVS